MANTKTFEEAINVVTQMIDNDQTEIHNANVRLSNLKVEADRETANIAAMEARIARNQSAVRLLEGAKDPQ